MIKPPSPSMCMGHSCTFRTYSPYVDEGQQNRGLHSDSMQYNLAQTNLPGPSIESESRLLKLTLLQLTNNANQNLVGE